MRNPSSMESSDLVLFSQKKCKVFNFNFHYYVCVATDVAACVVGLWFAIPILQSA